MHCGLSKEIVVEDWKKVELSAAQMFCIAYKQLCVCQSYFEEFIYSWCCSVQAYDSLFIKWLLLPSHAYLARSGGLYWERGFSVGQDFAGNQQGDPGGFR